METKDLLTVDTALQFLVKEFHEVAGSWNGDESGIAEDRASVANDIIEKAKELQNLLEEFENI